MQQYIVATGLTRRLVKANDAEKAIDVFLSDAVMRRALVGAREACGVHLATDAEIAEFKKGKPKPGDDQLALTLDDDRKSSSKPAKRTKKEHA